MTDKQIKLDGSWIPIEEAIKAGLISEKDINAPSKRLDRIDKMEIDLANYEQMERDIEKIIDPYQLDWELDCLSLPSAIQSILERKEQECETLASQLDFEVQKKECLEQECKELKDLNTRLDNQRETYWKGYQKLKATITEIKEIAEICKCHNTDGCYECKYFDDCEVEDEEIPTRDVCKLILQKISECEGNDEM